MDDPRHARIRRLVTRGLTPAAVRNLEPELRRRMRRLLEAVDEECDFLVDVAAELPMQAICLLLGVPEADRHLLFDAVEHIFDIPDESDFLSMTPEREAAVGLMYEYGAALISEKRAVPCPDMLSMVIHAELPDADPPQLSDDELSAFFSLVFSAGAETTRNAIAGAMLAFLEWPDQLDLLQSGQAAMGPPWRRSCVGPRRRPRSVGRRPRPASSGHTRISPGPKGRRLGRFGQSGSAALRRSRRVPAAARPQPASLPSATAPTSVSARTSPVWRSASPSRRSLRGVSSFSLAAPAQWTRSNRHTGIRHLPLRLHKATTSSAPATGV